MSEINREQNALAERDIRSDMSGSQIPELQAALLEHRQSKYSEARDLYARVLDLDPGNFDARHLLGVAEVQCGNVDVGIAHIEAALTIKPDSAEAHNNLGNALRGKGLVDDSLNAFTRAIEINPRYADPWYNKGRLLKDMGRRNEAIEAYQSTLAINPRHADASNNLGNLLKGRGDFDDAIEAYNQALLVAPRFAEAHNNLGNALKHIGKLEEANSAYRQAVEIRPTYFEAYANMGVALIDQGKFTDAFAAFEKSMEISPDYPEAHWNLSLLQLLTGDFAFGWASYEWRKKKAQPVALRDYKQPVLQGGEDINGKTVFVYFEQGLGDTFQFIRYVELLRARGAIVIVAVQDALVNLLRASFPGVLVIGAQQVPDKFDFHIPLLSLPFVFGTRLHTIPASVPYIVPDPERVEKWSTSLGASGFKIGICWQGSSGEIDRGRSFGISEFVGLGKIPGVRLISLHKGEGEAQLTELPEGMAVETLGRDFDPTGSAFLDSAAVMSICDLVITSDTSVAHLAGALGVPVWVALKHVPDWRWLLKRNDSPWYPTAQLFRQERRGDWQSVFAKIEQALKHMLGSGAMILTNGSRETKAVMPLVPVSWGEILDKITILEIKSNRLENPSSLSNVRRELAELDAIVVRDLRPDGEVLALKEDLRRVNDALWEIEDAIREQERAGTFSDAFIELARAVYKTNDERADIKRKLNGMTGSVLIEEKSYAPYDFAGSASA